MAVYEKLNFGMFRRIGDIWQENDVVQKYYIEVFLIQLRMHVILTGLSTESGQNSLDHMINFHFLLTIQLIEIFPVDLIKDVCNIHRFPTGSWFQPYLQKSVNIRDILRCTEKIPT